MKPINQDIKEKSDWQNAEENRYGEILLNLTGRLSSIERQYLDMPKTAMWTENKRKDEEIAYQIAIRSLQHLVPQVKEDTIETIKKKYAPNHEKLCFKVGKQFKKCLLCVLEDVLDSLKQK